MSRLTEVFSENEAKYICLKECKEDCQNGHIPTCQCKQNIEAWKKLAHYEDLEEQGRLVELPCKVGDTVYIPMQIRDNYTDLPRTVIAQACFKLADINRIGKTVFLTKEEAEVEVKLAELGGRT